MGFDSRQQSKRHTLPLDTCVINYVRVGNKIGFNTLEDIVNMLIFSLLV